MQQTAVINVVGLTSALLRHPGLFMGQWLKEHGALSIIDPVLPAVTCTAQATYLTGKWPSEHGIVGNGWYDREEAEVKMWKQSNRFVQSPKIWDMAKAVDPGFTCANMFWWYNMYSDVDFSVTPRPQYWADGQKKPDCYSQPAALRDRLQEALGIFPLFDFWGPKTTIRSSKWIADASKLVHEWHDPTLMLIYLPHLDYCCQKFAAGSAQITKDLEEIDAVVKDLILLFEKKGVQPIILSEYGISPVSQPIHINRVLRNNGYIQIREERGLELLDAGQCRAFALSDHQVAHVYIKHPEDVQSVKKLLEATPGIALVLDEQGKEAHHINHERAGELLVVADTGAWFTYYYWLDDIKAPDFARIVEIHRKPGYDPVEMFLDPDKKLIIPRILLKLIKKKLGFRTLMNVIPLDAGLVKGSHGATAVGDEDKPVWISKRKTPDSIKGIDVCGLILQSVFENAPLAPLDKSRSQLQIS